MPSPVPPTTSTHHTPAALYTDFTGHASIFACAAIGGPSLHRCKAAGGARFDAKTDGSEERSPRRTLSPLISCVISSDLPYLPPGTLDGARDAARGHGGQVHRGQGGGDVWNQPRAQAARRSTLITFPPRLNTYQHHQLLSIHHHNSSTYLLLLHHLLLRQSHWGEQFRLALKVQNDGEATPGPLAWVSHLLTLPFKLAFATVPPPTLLGGWPCFVVSISFIGVVTAFIGDVAALLGCVAPGDEPPSYEPPARATGGAALPRHGAVDLHLLPAGVSSRSKTR